MSESPYVFDVTDAEFEEAVLKKSLETPVVVDFWAPWCGPCRMLAPVLEDVINSFGGQVLLAKVNTDENPGAAQAFGVSGIPAVFALKGGQLANQFTGVLPEDQLRQWVSSLLPNKAEKLMSEGLKLIPSDLAGAEGKLREALQEDSEMDAARIALAEVLMHRNEDDAAQAEIDTLAKRGYLEPEAEHLAAELKVRRGVQSVGGVGECRSKLEADPENKQLQFELAEALAGAGEHEEAFKMLVKLVATDPSGIGKQAKDLLLSLFQTLGDASPLVLKYRKKLTMAMF